MNDEVPGYRILEQVGEGGFSLVYRARQERLDRVVALKVLSVSAVDDATMRRFQRECQITGRLTGHPNVVTVLDTGMTAAGRPYIAMDFFEHGSLRDRLTREGPFPVPDILRIGVKICAALAATHEAEVLHRDVKPQNILVSRYGEPALADFGVARLVDTSEATHTNAFTPHHAAPEVVNGQPPGVVSDIYSLGSSLYQLLAGAPAFKDNTDTGIGPLMQRILNQPPPRIMRGDLPPRVFEAIQISMAKEPADRFPTAVAFAARLQQLQSELGLPVTELASSGGSRGRPYPSGSGGPHGSTGPSFGFPGLAGPFPAAAENGATPAVRLGVTSDPMEHSAFKQLNPGLYGAPATRPTHDPVGAGSRGPQDLQDDVPADDVAPQANLGTATPGQVAPAHPDGTEPPEHPAAGHSTQLDAPAQPTTAAPTQAPALPTNFDGAASTRLGTPAAAPPTQFDGAAPAHGGNAAPPHPGAAPPTQFDGAPVAHWTPAPGFQQPPPTQQAMAPAPPPTAQQRSPARESTPRTLPPTQDSPPPSPPESARSTANGGVLLGVLVAVLVLAGLGIGAMAVLGGGGKKAPKAVSTTPGAQPLASAPPVDPAIMNAVRPYNVKVHDAGTLVTLSWQLGKQGKNVPILVEQSQAGQTAKSVPLTVANGTTSTPIAGLDPNAGYCFEIGAIAAFSTKSGQPAAIAWSVPKCIRGAQSQPTSQSH